MLFKLKCVGVLPVGLDVVGSTEKLDLPGAGRQSLDHAVDLIRFVTGGADLEECWNSGIFITLQLRFSGRKNHYVGKYKINMTGGRLPLQQ